MKRVISIFLVFFLCILLFACVPVSNELIFYPTIEAAFMSAEDSGRRDIDEVLFVAEFGDTATMVHKRRNLFITSHYLIEMRGNSAWYTCVGISRSTGYLIGYPSNSSIEAQPEIIYRLRIRHWGGLGRRIERLPVYGLSRDKRIHNLTINDQAPDYVILLEEQTYHPLFGETPLYFWYIADFQAEVNSPEDIVICFGE